MQIFCKEFEKYEKLEKHDNYRTCLDVYHYFAHNMACLTLNRLQRLMVGSKKKPLLNKESTFDEYSAINFSTYTPLNVCLNMMKKYLVKSF